MGHATSHNSFGPFDDTLVLWRLSDAGTCCGRTQRLLFRDCVWTLDWTELTGLALIFHSMSLQNGMNHTISFGRTIFACFFFFQGLLMWIYVWICAVKNNHSNKVRISWQWPPVTVYLRIKSFFNNIFVDFFSSPFVCFFFKTYFSKV